MSEIRLLTSHSLMGQPLRFLKGLSLEGVDAVCLLLDAVRLFITDVRWCVPCFYLACCRSRT